jgi:GT2 family glycosyltransferase
VNSGGGDPKAVIGGVDGNVRVITRSDRLLPGAARNLGIEASHARWIAFMASDHIATDGWVAARLEAHRRGNPVVASAVINSHPKNLFALASHVSLLVRRLPGVPPEEALPYGASYERGVFERYGKFRGDLRIGEDTDFNDRLVGQDRAVWTPSIQTIHRSPTSFGDMLRDQYARGRRSGRIWPQHQHARFIRRLSQRLEPVIRLSWAAMRGRERVLLLASWPLVVMCVVSYCVGVSVELRHRSRA